MNFFNDYYYRYHYRYHHPYHYHDHDHYYYLYNNDKTVLFTPSSSCSWRFQQY